MTKKQRITWTYLVRTARRLLRRSLSADGIVALSNVSHPVSGVFGLRGKGNDRIRRDKLFSMYITSME